MTVPATFAEFSWLSCIAGGNQFKDNQYCRVKDGFWKGDPKAKNASIVEGNVQKCRDVPPTMMP